MLKNNKFKALLNAPEILIAPGAYDALTAMLIAEAGFQVIYATGAGIANTQFGFPDVGLTTMNDVLEQVRRMVDAVDCPIVADIDTGFGNFLNIIRTVKAFEKAGVSALQIEDQVFPKKCGHFEGKEVISPQEMVDKIKAALDARQNEDLVIIARTDARAVFGLEAALERAQRYLETGADAIFVEAPATKEELVRIPDQIKIPLVVNMVEYGKTPICTSQELEAMGYSMVLYANSVLRASVKAVQDLLGHLKINGDTLAILDRIISMEERNRLTGLDRIYELEKKYLSDRREIK